MAMMTEVARNGARAALHPSRQPERWSTDPETRADEV